MRVSMILIGLGLALGFATSVWAKSLDCEPDKLKAAGKYSFCRLKAASNAIKKSEAPDYSKCDSRFSRNWQKAESRALGTCPTEGDEAAIQAKMVGDADTIMASLSGVPGVRFVDNGDGTVSDNRTGLMWEKKDPNSGCLHCVDDTYNWFDAMSQWITEVNGFTDDPNVQAGLGGHSDWRLPTVVELQTILLEPAPCSTDPCIHPIFGPTALSFPAFFYWSSSTKPNGNAWVVFFGNGGIGNGGKAGLDLFVRAVRGP